MRAVYSFGVNDPKLREAIESYKNSGGNLSRLICNLLQQYFFGNNNKEVLTKEMLLLLDIKKKMDEFLRWRNEILPKIEELERKLKEEQEHQRTKEEIPLIRELRYSVFADIEDFESFESRLIRYGRNPRDAIKARLQAWAAEKQTPYPEAVRLFCKAFPELKVKVFEKEGSKPCGEKRGYVENAERCS